MSDKKNVEIKLKKNVGQVMAQQKANILLEDNPWFYNGYIYVVCPNVSDLFIVEKRKVRPCKDDEWGFYFNTYLVNNKEFDKTEVKKKRWQHKYK